MANFRLFTTTGYNGTAAVIDLGEQTTALGTGRYYLYPTYDKAIAALTDNEDGSIDTVAPVPPMIVNGVQYGFFDDNGFPVKTVEIKLTRQSNDFAKGVDLRGGAYRLRFCNDFSSGSSRCNYQFKGDSVLTDIDFVEFRRATSTSYSSYCGAFRKNVNFYRCVFAGMFGLDAIEIDKNSPNFYNCAFFSNALPSGKTGITLNGGTGFHYYNCLCYYGVNNDLYKKGKITAVDCINLYGLTQEQVNAIGFVSPPKVYDTSNYGYNTDGTEWTKDDWKSVDLHLLPTSPYITGATAAINENTAYGLDGLPRKEGGAIGPYEYYAIDEVYSSDATPTTSGTLAIRDNAAIDSSLSASKIIIDGCAHVDLGDNECEAEIVLGKNAFINFSKNITSTIISSNNCDVYLYGRYDFDKQIVPFKNNSIVFLGRVYKQSTSDLIVQNEVASIKLTVYKYNNYKKSAESMSVVSSYSNVTIDRSCFFETPKAFDIWNKNSGCNFCWSPVLNPEAFTSNSGKYLASFKATLVSGAKETFSFVFEVL